MRKKEDSLFKNGIYYFWRMQVNAILSLILSLIPVIPVRMVFSDKYIQDSLIAIFSILIECVGLFFIFAKEEQTNKYTLGRFLLPCTIAFPLHFLLCSVTKFFPFLAGMAVSSIATMIWASILGENLANLSYDVVPFYIPFLLFLAFLVLKFVCVWRGYLWAQKKRGNSIDI